MTRITSALFIGLVLVVSSLSQTPKAVPTPPEEDDVVQITTTLIQIDAIVTGKNNKQVTDLKASDFEIFENGKKREISFFSYVSLDRANSRTAEAAKDNDDKKNEVTIPTTKLAADEVRRAYAIVVDDLGISFENFPRLKRALRKFVDEDVIQGDLVAIVRTGNGSGALQSFTSDKRQLYASIEKLRWNPQGRSGVSSFDPIRTSLKEDLANSVGADGAVTTPSGVEDDRRFEQQVGDIRRSNFQAGTLGALTYIIRGMDMLPGRKSIILFSEGFTTVSRDSNIPDTIYDRLRLVIDYANRASVTFYTIDPRGLQVPGMAMAADDIREVVPTSSTVSKAPLLDERERQFRDSITTLRYLAYETGGVPFVNNNSLTKGLDTALEDQKGYYLIAYEPDEETFDPKKAKFNDIKVKVNVDGLKVRTRNGFYAVPDRLDNQSAAGSVEEQIYRSLTSPFDAGGISLTLNTLYAVDERKNAFIQSLVFIKGTDLEFKENPDGTRSANFDILAATFSDANVPIDEASRNFTVTLGENSYRDALEKGFVYRLNVPIKKPGAFQFRVAVRDSASKKIGSASQFVSVPNLKKKNLELSSIVLNRYSTREWQLLKTGTVPETRANYDNSIDNALRLFRTGDVLQFGYIIYNAKSNSDISLSTRLIKDGRVITEGEPSALDRSTANDPSAMETAGAITLGKNLGPGDYVLQVIVRDLKSKKRRATATQWVEFEIER